MGVEHLPSMCKAGVQSPVPHPTHTHNFSLKKKKNLTKSRKLHRRKEGFVEILKDE